MRTPNLSPHAEPGNRSRVVEVGGATEDHYANLTPPLETIGKTFSIVSDPVFKNAKSVSAKLKNIKESVGSKVKHPASIQVKDMMML